MDPSFVTGSEGSGTIARQPPLSTRMHACLASRRLGTRSVHARYTLLHAPAVGQALPHPRASGDRDLVRRRAILNLPMRHRDAYRWPREQHCCPRPTQLRRESGCLGHARRKQATLRGRWRQAERCLDGGDGWRRRHAKLVTGGAALIEVGGAARLQHEAWVCGRLRVVGGTARRHPGVGRPPTACGLDRAARVGQRSE